MFLYCYGSQKQLGGAASFILMKKTVLTVEPELDPILELHIATTTDKYHAFSAAAAATTTVLRYITT